MGGWMGGGGYDGVVSVWDRGGGSVWVRGHVGYRLVWVIIHMYATPYSYEICLN